MHTAADYGDPSFTQMGDGKRTYAINYGGMQNLMRAGRAAGVKQLIYTSSVDTAFCGGFSTENATTDNFMDKYVDVRCPDYGPPDHYAATKLRAEREMLKSDGESGMRTVSIRPNGIYGPSENSYIPKAIIPGYLMNYVFFYFDKEQKSDMTCLPNLVYAHMLAVKCLNENPDQCGGKPYFITDGVVTNNAAWNFFQPIMEATGAFVQTWLWLPPKVLITTSHYLEQFGIPGMTEKEAYKGVTTHTHSIANAQKDLGYRVLMPQYECLCHTGNVPPYFKACIYKFSISKLVLQLLVFTFIETTASRRRIFSKVQSCEDRGRIRCCPQHLFCEI
jgi:3beta-hydroxy-delta5-steroid dehydrogenase/steroid delta-isomerase